MLWRHAAHLYDFIYVMILLADRIHTSVDYAHLHNQLTPLNPFSTSTTSYEVYHWRGCFHENNLITPVAM